ncbi:MAG: DUF2064 domain-containing protein [Eudoraea sp.]|nr:DUF2064 domain-containing protein [Eudoraea sp.]
MDQKHIALLIFALSPEAELEHKNISGEKALYTLLNEHSLKLAKGMGIPYFHFTERDQEGNTFGERYTHAIKKIFALGYDGVITIGNDSPGLTIRHLQTAYQNLLRGNTVLGPSLDGGFYLLAIPKSIFSAKEFLSIPWKSARVFRQMHGLLNRRNGESLVLDPLCDLDSQADIAYILDSHINIPFGIKMILIESRLLEPIAKTGSVFYTSLQHQVLILNRGSPAIAA